MQRRNTLWRLALNLQDEKLTKFFPSFAIAGSLMAYIFGNVLHNLEIVNGSTLYRVNDEGKIEMLEPEPFLHVYKRQYDLLIYSLFQVAGIVVYGFILRCKFKVPFLYHSPMLLMVATIVLIICKEYKQFKYITEIILILIGMGSSSVLLIATIVVFQFFLELEVPLGVQYFIMGTTYVIILFIGMLIDNFSVIAKDYVFFFIWVFACIMQLIKRPYIQY